MPDDRRTMGRGGRTTTCNWPVRPKRGRTSMRDFGVSTMIAADRGGRPRDFSRGRRSTLIVRNNRRRPWPRNFVGNAWPVTARSKPPSRFSTRSVPTRPPLCRSTHPEPVARLTCSDSRSIALTSTSENGSTLRSRSQRDEPSDDLTEEVSKVLVLDAMSDLGGAR